MKKKVGILSFPRYFNYGTFLQLYALQTAVSRLGYEPEVIDYDPYNDSGRRPLAGSKQPMWWKAAKRVSRRLRDTLAFQVNRSADLAPADNFAPARNALFEEFLHTRLNLGRRTYFTKHELECFPPACDAAIVGSDQVWHPVAHYKDQAYFLSFVDPNKRIAYAPSIGLSEIPESTRDWMRDRIEAIPHLSIRESVGAKLVSELTGREAPVVLDPAYLLEATEWSEFSNTSVSADRPYLMCYFLESDEYMRERAKQLAAEHGLNLYLVPVHQADVEREDPAFHKLEGVGPQEFVGLLRNAALVCTDSFHGTSFSVIFNRPFLTFRRYDNPAQVANHSRLDSILTMLGLESQLQGEASKAPLDPLSVDFSLANQRLAELRDESLDFLERSLAAATASTWQRSAA
jgi:hypothetical protein